ncbi:MAG: SDR family NAD(P)-dependent oxidoreductase [Moraxellaceae bacterium]
MSLNPRIHSWQNRRIWIIGASSGIGHALASQLLQMGAQVALSSRNPGKLQSMADLWPQKTLVLPFDVKDVAGWENAYTQLKEKWDWLDHIILCAADYAPVRAASITADNVRSMMDTNVIGIMTGVAVVLPDFLKTVNGGAISIVASVAGYTGLPKALVYGPTKAALINFTESLYLDVHAQGLTVHLINPGFVNTPLTQKNDFHMPALITPETAAQHIVAGMEKGDFEIHFPRRFTLWLKLLRQLPYCLRFHLLRNMAHS